MRLFKELTIILFEKFRLIKNRINKFLLGFLLSSKNIKCDGKFKISYFRRLSVGDNFSINHNVILNAKGSIRIGNNVTLSSGCQILSTGLNSSREHILKPISIGNNVWVGAGAFILPGVEISDDVTIGAGSVVTKSILSKGSTAVGVPALILNDD